MVAFRRPLLRVLLKTLRTEEDFLVIAGAEQLCCLSSASFSQTIAGEGCLSTCSNGCIHCSICIDPLCALCPDIDNSVCSQCIEHAEVVSACQCIKGYYLNNRIIKGKSKGLEKLLD